MNAETFIAGLIGVAFIWLAYWAWHAWWDDKDKYDQPWWRGEEK